METGPAGTGGRVEDETSAVLSGRMMDDTPFVARASEGLHNRAQEQHGTLEVPQPSESSSSGEADGGESTSGANLRRDSGLRGKRGGAALKIHVVSPPKEDERRRRSHFAANLAENAPLFPLDLSDHVIEGSNPYDESDRRGSSVFEGHMPNGFGSPIELPAGYDFGKLARGRNGAHGPGSTRDDSLASFVDIPQSRKFEPATVEASEDGKIGGALMRERDPRRGGSFARYVVKTAILIVVWYILSLLLTLYNKILLGRKNRNFPAPLMMITIHFSMQGIVSTILIRCIPSFRPSFQVSWKDYFIRVVPTALATALDIDLTNVSLVLVTLSFVTMCKSSSPVFLLIFAFLFKLEVPSYKLFGIIVIISTGVMLTVTEATDFNLWGFILVMSAAVMAGFRMVVTQMLLQKEEYGLNNPFATMSVLTPIMAAGTGLLSLILEQWSTLGSSVYFNSTPHILSSCALMLLGGTLAFFMVTTEYILLSETSAVTLTVAGVVKEVVTILGAVIILKDKFNLQKGAGLAIIIVGVSLYNLYKYQKMREKQRIEDHGLNGTHKYVALMETKPVFELGDDIDEDLP